MQKKLLSLYIFIAAMIATATPAYAKIPPNLNLSGTYTVTETYNHTSRESDINYSTTQSHVKAKFTLPGRIYRQSTVFISPARASVLEHSYRNDTVIDGEHTCLVKTFAGIMPSATIPPQPFGHAALSVYSPSMNPRTKTARISLQMTKEAPFVKTMTHTCADQTPYEDFLPLVNESIYGYGSGALLGSASFAENRPNAATTDPLAIMSLNNVLMKYENGRWRSSGKKIIEGKYWDGSPGTFILEWKLVSTRPSVYCANIPNKIIRGKTVTQVKRIIAQSGFRVGPIYKQKTSVRVAKGRVFSVMTSHTPCNSRVPIFVKK